MRSLAPHILLTATLFTAAACGHSIMRGSVVMKISDTEAHVCLGRGEVAHGDRVDLVRHVCRTKSDTARPSGASVPLQVGQCERQVLARGEVERVLNEHYSVVRFPVGTEFQESSSVEKARR